MTYKKILQDTAIQCLQGMMACHIREDYEGLTFFTNIYSAALRDITDLNATDNSYLTEEQTEYLFADMQIDVTGKLISTPE
jgi:hypothetical protein